mmetsp:Transcript_63059/g.112070  ORF Transcript_63059/g.112070 Transcript_63059/m.112070 type:complete len:585 (-) Transcript_63059:8-1762(-)
MHFIYFICVAASLLQVSAKSPGQLSQHAPGNAVTVQADSSLISMDAKQGAHDAHRLGAEYGHSRSRWAIEQVLANKLRFFLYELDPRFNTDLLTCYEEFANQSIWSDFSEEKGQNVGEIWIHRILESHTLRTSDPEKASVFFIPFYGFLSTFFSAPANHISNTTLLAGDTYISKTICKGAGHIDRANALAAFLKEQPHFKKMPERHVLPVSFWAVARKTWSDDALPHSVVSGDLFDILQNSTLLVPEPQFQSMMNEKEYLNWPGPLLTLPYVAKPSLVESRPPGPYIGRKASNFFFQGELHNGPAGKPVGRRNMLGKYFKNLSDAVIADTFKHSPTDNSYENGMRNSNFCLVFEGDTPTTPRLFDAIAAGCIPLILSDNISLPFRSLITWSAFSIQLPEAPFLAEVQDEAGHNTSLLQATRPHRHRRAKTVEKIGAPHPHIDAHGKADSDEFANFKLPMPGSLRDLPLHESMFMDEQAFSEMKSIMTHQVKEGMPQWEQPRGPVIDVQTDAKSMIEQLRGLPSEKLFFLQMNVNQMRDKFIFGYGTPNNVTRDGGAIDMILTQLGTSLNLITSTDRVSFLSRMS